MSNNLEYLEAYNLISMSNNLEYLEEYNLS